MPRKKKSKLPKPNNLKLFLLGLILTTIFFGYKIHNAIRLSFATPFPSTPISTISAIPASLSIPSLKVKLPVFPTAIVKNTWQVSEDGASYLATSAKPGENGPIILYSHNTVTRFGPIRWLEKGATITITTTNDTIHSYQVSEILTVTPKDVNALLSEKETLILYTCTGLFDQDRYIVRAIPL